MKTFEGTVWVTIPVIITVEAETTEEARDKAADGEFKLAPTNSWENEVNMFIKESEIWEAEFQEADLNGEQQ